MKKQKKQLKTDQMLRCHESLFPLAAAGEVAWCPTGITQSLQDNTYNY